MSLKRLIDAGKICTDHTNKKRGSAVATALPLFLSAAPGPARMGQYKIQRIVRSFDVDGKPVFSYSVQSKQQPNGIYFISQIYDNANPFANLRKAQKRESTWNFRQQQDILQ